MSYQDFLAQTRIELRALYKAAPGPSQGFTQLSNAVKAEGVLSLKEKEFIAVGIAVAQRCEPCITFHVEALMKTGATREELAETLGMAIQMGGGPALMYAGSALACWDELAANND
jgi:AhpD family alkylhydroperoxidase